MTYQTLGINTYSIASEVAAETLLVQREYARFGEEIFDPDFPYDPGVPMEDSAEDEAFWETLYAD